MDDSLLFEKILLYVDDENNTYEDSESENVEIKELSICNIDEFKMLIQNFFENDNYHVQQRIYNKDAFCAFTFGYKKYNVFFLGEKDKLKKIVIKFFDFLKNIMIQKFECYSFCLDEEHDHHNDIINLIGDIIKNSNVIEYIFIPIYSLKDDALKILHNCIVDHKSLKHLEFSYSTSKMPHVYVNYLDNIIKNSNIENISGLHDDEYSYFFEKLLDNFFRGRNLDLNIYDKNISDDLVLKLSDMIKKKEINYLKKIDLSYNKITSKGFSTLVDSLLQSKNENIIKISIYDNKLDDDCIESLGELIKKNKNMSCIYLGCNDITDKGIEKLSEYIIGNVFIKSVNINENVKITDVSSEVIKHMIKSSSISSIELNKTNISKKNMDEIKELLKIPIEEREIPLITFQNVKSASKIMKE